MTAPAIQPTRPPELRRADLLAIGILILLCYAPAIVSMGRDWIHNDDMGHGFFVPVVAAYLVWQRRAELMALPARPCWWGLAMVALGAAQSLIATLGVELFLSRSAVIVTLTGAVWLVGGTAILKRLAFPLFLLCFMVPIPAVIFNSITFPLQILASRLAEYSLDALSVPVLRQGNVLELPSGPLSVVEACSGIRSLLSLTFLSLVYGCFFEERRWIRGALFVATIPIAILANGGRVTMTGLLAEVKPELAQGFFHESTGWVIFMLALCMLVVFHQIIRRGARLLGRRG